MFTVVTVIHVVACLVLIGIVLLQQGKGADMGAVFGGSSSTIFGSSGAGNFLTRMTTATAVIFMLTSLTLTYTTARNVTSTVFDEGPLQEPPPLEQPAAPQAAAPAGEAIPLQVELTQPEGAQQAPAAEVQVGGQAFEVEAGVREADKPAAEAAPPAEPAAP
jgi:preprotein translocase subunit SecG